MADAEAIVERGQRFVQQVRQVGAAGDPLRDRPHRGEMVPLRGDGRNRGSGHPFDRENPIDIGTLQAEHPGHARVRGDAREVSLHALEQRPAGLDAQVFERDPVARERIRFDHQRGRSSRRQHVLPRLVEELERQRDVLRIHVVDLGHEGDVRNTVGRAGGDGCRRHAIQCPAYCVEWNRHVASGMPALGPGVCSKAAPGVKSIASSSSCAPAHRARAWSSSWPRATSSAAKAST